MTIDIKSILNLTWNVGLGPLGSRPSPPENSSSVNGMTHVRERRDPVEECRSLNYDGEAVVMDRSGRVVKQ